MGVTADIAESYRGGLRRVVRRHLAAGAREDRALALLMLGCALVFVGQWPRLMRLAQAPGAAPFEAMIGGALLGWLFLAPLALYALAALSHLLARAIGGRGSFYGARVALFWALLAAAPLWLVNGLVFGLAGEGWVSRFVGGLALGIFLVFWLLGLVEAERPAARRASAPDDPEIARP